MNYSWTNISIRQVFEMFNLKPPYEITQEIWTRYYADQQSGHMNMLAHPLVMFFLGRGVWQKAYDHFEVNGNEDTLTITEFDE